MFVKLSSKEEIPATAVKARTRPFMTTVAIFSHFSSFCSLALSNQSQVLWLFQRNRASTGHVLIFFKRCLTHMVHLYFFVTNVEFCVIQRWWQFNRISTSTEPCMWISIWVWLVGVVGFSSFFLFVCFFFTFSLFQRRQAAHVPVAAGAGSQV